MIVWAACGVLAIAFLWLLWREERIYRRHVREQQAETRLYAARADAIRRRVRDEIEQEYGVRLLDGHVIPFPTPRADRDQGEGA